MLWAEEGRGQRTKYLQQNVTQFQTAGAEIKLSIKVVYSIHQGGMIGTACSSVTIKSKRFCVAGVVFPDRQPLPLYP